MRRGRTSEPPLPGSRHASKPAAGSGARRSNAALLPPAPTPQGNTHSRLRSTTSETPPPPAASGGESPWLPDSSQYLASHCHRGARASSTRGCRRVGEQPKNAPSLGRLCAERNRPGNSPSGARTGARDAFQSLRRSHQHQSDPEKPGRLLGQRAGGVRSALGPAPAPWGGFSVSRERLRHSRGPQPAAPPGSM